jgi:hypothetical protein
VEPRRQGRVPSSSISREAEERSDQDDQPEGDGAVEGLVDGDRQHDVGDDQDLKAQQDRPADILSGTLVGRPTPSPPPSLSAADTKASSEPTIRIATPATSNPSDDPFHPLGEVHPRSPELARILPPGWLAAIPRLGEVRVS